MHANSAAHGMSDDHYWWRRFWIQFRNNRTNITENKPTNVIKIESVHGKNNWNYLASVVADRSDSFVTYESPWPLKSMAKHWQSTIAVISVCEMRIRLICGCFGIKLEQISCLPRNVPKLMLNNHRRAAKAITASYSLCPVYRNIHEIYHLQWWHLLSLWNVHSTWSAHSLFDGLLFDWRCLCIYCKICRINNKSTNPLQANGAQIFDTYLVADGTHGGKCDFIMDFCKLDMLFIRFQVGIFSVKIELVAKNVIKKLYIMF